MLLGGGWEEGAGRCRWQDAHLRGAKEGRAFNSCFSVTVVSSLSREMNGLWWWRQLAVAWILWLGWGCLLLTLLFRSEQSGLGWQALHRCHWALGE